MVYSTVGYTRTGLLYKVHIHVGLVGLHVLYRTHMPSLTYKLHYSTHWPTLKKHTCRPTIAYMYSDVLYNTHEPTLKYTYI